MKIRTKSIIDQIELELDKDLNDITEEDLKEIKSLNINGLNILGEHQSIYVDDIKYLTSLESINLYNLEIDGLILETLKEITTLKSILFNRCEIFDFPCVFFNITNVSFEFCDNFFNDILNSFPNVTNLTLKGHNINYIPRTVKVFNILKSKVTNYEIFDNIALDELYVSSNEYNNNPIIYNKMNTKVYDENDCYIVNKGDK